MSPRPRIAKVEQTLDQKTLETAAALPVWSETGEEVKFGTLFAERKTIVVFISMSVE